MKYLIELPPGVSEDDFLGVLKGFSAATGKPEIRKKRISTHWKEPTGIDFGMDLLIVPIDKIETLEVELDTDKKARSQSILVIDTTPAEYAILHLLHEKLKGKAPF